jgi:Predicted flavoprotein involved in K+ transport
LDTNYFETFNKNNVDLIDLKSNPIEECYNSGLIVNKRKIPADIIIFATGFDAITGSLLGIDIQGKNSKDLSSEWRIQPNNYLGLQIPNFPNLFTITGPGSPSVLTNMPRAIEQHVEWITNCISYLLREKKSKIEACPKYSKNWLKKVHDAEKKTMFLKTENSW